MKVKDAIREALLDAVEKMGLSARGVGVVLEKPRLEVHGDISTPLALTLAKSLNKDPLDLAERIAKAAELPKDVIASVRVAKPGFINLTFTENVLQRNLLEILSNKDSYGSSSVGVGEKYQVEYVSANPTGPLVVVSARAAAIGSAIVNLLSFIGYEVESEYYVNDYGSQIQALGESLRFRLRERLGKLAPGQEIGAYPGEYLRDIADSLPRQEATGLVDDRGRADGGVLGKLAAEKLLEGIKIDLGAFGVAFDRFFYESSLHPKTIEEALQIIRERGFAYEREGAVYFRSSRLGDEKDRVLRKSDGSPTYFLGDVAYHLSKLRRGYKHIIDLWGPDHHGHVARMEAASDVLGAGPDWLEVLIIGWVRLMEEGKPVGMSKRSGEFITMRELIEDVGRDAAKYFFLMRRSNSPLDFDLSLARKQSEENPVYYVQYAHARISSVVRYARSKGASRGEVGDLGALSSQEERSLMLHLIFFPYVVEAAARTREPHRLTAFAQELATLFHHFYQERRIVSDDKRLSGARLVLAEATGQVLRNVLRLLGVGAPRSM